MLPGALGSRGLARGFGSGAVGVGMGLFLRGLGKGLGILMVDGLVVTLLGFVLCREYVLDLLMPMLLSLLI